MNCFYGHLNVAMFRVGILSGFSMTKKKKKKKKCRKYYVYRNVREVKELLLQIFSICKLSNSAIFSQL